jgi:hypothetical protein
MNPEFCRGRPDRALAAAERRPYPPKQKGPGVAEHRIRLRGGWSCCAAGLRESQEERLTLPIAWGPDAPERLRLTRRFGRPPFDQDRESLVLELDQVAGIHALLLDGALIAGVLPERRHYEIRLDRSSERHTLVLEIEPPKPELDPTGKLAEWGHVALVIRPHDRAISEPASSS